MSGTQRKHFINPETKPCTGALTPDRCGPVHGEKEAGWTVIGRLWEGDVTLTSSLSQNANAEAVGEQERSRVHG